MKLPLGLYVLSLLVVTVLWWGLGRPEPMPGLTGAASGRPCLSYAPFRGDESPLVGDIQIDPARIAADLSQLATRTGCIRTYGVNHGTHLVPELAKQAGLKVMLGIWLAPERDRNRKQIDTAIELAQRYPDVVSAVVVGNEVLLRGEMTPADLGATIREVKAAVPVPVTYADVPEFWVRHPDLAQDVDFVTIHLLPYWEDFPTPVAGAVAHAEATRQKIAALLPDKEIFIGEIGWPSAGRMRDGALPSRVSQARFLHEVMALADREKFGVNLIEAFDQPWKRQREGTVGGYWGLFDAEGRAPKFAWGQPVSNHPFWPGQALLGVLLVSLIFLAAGRSARGAGEAMTASWFGVAVIAGVAGTAIGWAVEAMWVESLGLSGWIVSMAWVAVAALAPIAGAAALMGGQRVPPLHRVMGPPARWPRDRRAVAAGLALAALVVLTIQTAMMLVFDPRYVDFPFAQLIGGLVPFVVLAWRRPQGSRPVAEKTATLILALSAVYILLNEGLTNWQAVSFCLALGVLALTLVSGRGEPD
jgi:exo-beta-1,3-glucanase (GH17 family)